MSDKYKIDVELVFFNVTYVVVNDKPLARVANARERGKMEFDMKLNEEIRKIKSLEKKVKILAANFEKIQGEVHGIIELYS
jgi:hypothetical protein